MKSLREHLVRLTGLSGLNPGMLGLLGGDLLAKGGMLLTFAIMARWLGESAFGLVAWSQAIVAYASIAVDLGLSAFGTREVAREPRTAGWYWGLILRLRLGLALGLTLLLAVGGFLFLPTDVAGCVLLASGCWLVPYALGSEWLVQAAHRTAWIGLLRLGTSLTLLLLTWIWTSGPAGVATAAALRFGAEWAGVVIGWIMARRIIAAEVAQNSGLGGTQTIKAAAPLMLSVLFTSVYAANFDTILLGVFHAPAEAGSYAAAQRLYLMLAVIPKLLLAMYYPRFARAHATRGPAALQQDFTQLIRTAVLLGAPVIALTMLLAPEIVQVVYGSGYESSVLPLRLLAIGAFPLLLAAGLPNMLMAARQERPALNCFAIAMVVNLVLNFILIPRFGSIGAACVAILAETSVFLSGIYYAKRRLGVVLPPVRALTWCLLPPLAAVTLAFIGRWLAQFAGFTLPLAIIATAGILGMLAAAGMTLLIRESKQT